MSRVVLSDAGTLLGGFLKGITTAETLNVTTLNADALVAPAVIESTLQFIPSTTAVAADSAQTYTAAAVYAGGVARGPLTAGRTDTLPTGTNLDLARANGVTSFFFAVTNTTGATHAITLQGNTGNTLQDTTLSGAIPATETALFVCIRFGTNTWRTIRIDT